MQEQHKGFNHGPDSYCRKLYPIICLSNIILNFDNGILPAATVEIMKDLDVDEIKYGLLGSIIYLGLVVGSFMAGVLFQKYPAKNILSFCTFMMMVSLSIFTFTKNMNALVFARISCGFFQVFLVIYFPVWVDIYGKGKRTIWLTYLQVGVPLGIFLGYAVTAIASSYISWKFSFWIQIVFMFPTLLVFLFCSDVYIDTKVYIRKFSQGLSQELEYVIENSISSNLDDLYVPGQFTIETSEKNIILPQDEANVNLDMRPPAAEIKEPLITTRHISVLDAVKVLWNSKVYIYSMLSICSLDFIVTGIQFWLSDYLRNIMSLEKSVVFATYSLLSITGPTIGVIVGGYIVDKKGGYKSKNALPICGIFAVLASLTAAPVPFIDIFWVMVVLLWFLLFFGGALMPAATGIMISAVPRDYRAFANSAAQTFANLFGYLPSPFLYGMVLKFTGGQKSRWGMLMLMYWSLWGLIGLLLAYRADRIKRSLHEKKNKLPINNNTEKRPDNENKSADFVNLQKEVEIVQTKTFGEDGTPLNSRIFGKADKFSLSNEFIPKNEYSMEGDRLFNSDRLRYSLDISQSPFVAPNEKRLKMGDMSQSSYLQGTYQMTASRQIKKMLSPQTKGRHSSLFNFNISPSIIQNIPLPEKFRAKKTSPEKEKEQDKAEQRSLFHSSRENILIRWKSDRQNIQEEDEKVNANDSSQTSDNVKGMKLYK